MISNYFEKMSSNTVAGTSNQMFYNIPDQKREYTGRVFYKVFAGGKYNYSFLFSGSLDSTFCFIPNSVCNLEVTGWAIKNARVGTAKTCTPNDMPKVENFTQLYFDGKKEKQVNSPTLFCSDEISIDVNSGEYICLEITYQGKRIPCHEEALVPCFLFDGEKWVADAHCIVANMVGCDRKVDKKIAFFGDSITQGIGVENNSYDNWCALVSKGLSKKNAYWNIGIGCGRINDVATDKVWLYKAKQNDIVFMCFGVNDLLQLKNPKQIKLDLLYSINALKSAGCRVILQNIPPFDYCEEDYIVWTDLNSYIRKELIPLVDLFIDNQGILESERGGTKYGGHPNAEGSKIWAEHILSKIKEII